MKYSSRSLSYFSPQESLRHSYFRLLHSSLVHTPKGEGNRESKHGEQQRRRWWFPISWMDHPAIQNQLHLPIQHRKGAHFLTHFSVSSFFLFIPSIFHFIYFCISYEVTPVFYSNSLEKLFWLMGLFCFWFLSSYFPGFMCLHVLISVIPSFFWKRNCPISFFVFKSIEEDVIVSGFVLL